MSIFKFLFGGKKPNKLIKYDNPVNKPQPIPTYTFEELKNLIPSSFNDLLRDKSGSDIILELPDEKYRVLRSLTKDSNTKDIFENIVDENRRWNYRYPDDVDKITIPFARNLSGDQFKYLYFQGESGVTDFSSIYMTDSDSNIGLLEITKGLRNISAITFKEIDITLIPQSISDLMNDFVLPNSIAYRKESFSCHINKLEVETLSNLGMEQYAMNYRFEDKNDDFVNIEIHTSITINNTKILAYSEYDIENSKLGSYITLGTNYYRTFYYKYFCIIHSWILFKNYLLKEEICTAEEFTSNMNISKLIEFSKASFKGIETRHP